MYFLPHVRTVVAILIEYGKNQVKNQVKNLFWDFEENKAYWVVVGGVGVGSAEFF